MEQYISKAAVVAEIERILDNSEEVHNNQYILLCNHFKSFLNTLEVKEVGLDYIKDELDRAVKIYNPNGDFGWGTLYNIATYFFELGLKAQNNIDDDVQKQKERLLSEIEETVDGIDYYTVDGLLITIKEKIEELKARKGE